MHDDPGEIAKIEHELEILRSRYAIFSYWAVVVKWFCTAAAVVILILVVLMATREPVISLVVAFVILLHLLIFYLWTDNRKFRWIDLVSPNPWWPLARPGYFSEAKVVEDMIADREARLAQLRRSPA